MLRSSSLPQDPSGHESAISASIAALAQYDSQIERLQEALESMQADRAKLREYVGAWRSLSSPIRRLPPEILCEIFVPLSLPANTAPEWLEDPLDTKGALADLAKSQLLCASEVCTSWRNLIIGTPKLWSSIVVRSDRWPGDPAQFLAALQTCLARGAQHPLSLDFSSSCDRPSSQIVWELLVDHSDRWKVVSLDVPSRALKTAQRAHGRLHMLQILSLAVRSDTDVTHSTDIFTTSPSLKRVKLVCPNMQNCPKLPWSQLHTFTCQAPPDPKHFTSVLGWMADLSHPEAEFWLRHLHSASPIPLPTIKSTISSLIVDIAVFWGPQHVVTMLNQFLGCLTLPHLRELSVLGSVTKGIIPWPANEFELLSSRSSFHDTLRVLNIPTVSITEDELVRTLACLDSLERLIIADRRENTIGQELTEHVLITDSLLRRLTYTTDEPDLHTNLVPQLQSISCTSLCRFSTQILFDFVASRTVASRGGFEFVLARFREVKADFEPEVRQKFSELVTAGALQLHLK
ncbi:hypothetical protein C8R47DRAFT_596745 [Mycena vitilis]|nr:hypothetical protein C8R47DRAFT_596745 [Mycena vitilis]